MASVVPPTTRATVSKRSSNSSEYRKNEPSMNSPESSFHPAANANTAPISRRADAASVRRGSVAVSPRARAPHQ